MITNEEIQLTRDALSYALAQGAGSARVTLAESQEDLVATLNGEVDKVTHCLDRSLNIALIVNGRYGSFSTNKLGKESLEDFIRKSIAMTGMLSADACRCMPDPLRCAHDAVSGNELDLLDPCYDSISPQQRNEIALGASIFRSLPEGAAYTVISEEGEYSDSIYDTIMMDSNGVMCRHTENSFDYGVETTIECEGDRYSGYWWDSSSRLAGIDAPRCGREALRRAAAQIGSKPMRSGKYNMVIESNVASKAVSPVLRALNAYSIQQNNSFLMDSLGKQVFPEGMTIMDLPRIKGQNCSKLFDSEGVATKEGPIIENGVVKEYFVNSYMARKLDMAPTIEDPVRPKVLPWPCAGLDQAAILRKCGHGILVTDFNGGNCNSATGDFSYGVEGFYFKNGKIVKPVSGMLVTGNFITLWQNLIACGDDARDCMSKLIPTLAFAKVDFSG